MTIRRAGWDELSFAALLVAGLATVGLPGVPVALLRLPVASALPTGVLAGAALFALLAGARSRRLPACRPRRLLGRRGVVLVARAAVEEVAWRGFLLGALAAPLGWLPALAVSSAGFACAHGGGRGRLVHLLTGGVFGALYLASGRLAAAVAAHVVYNALVLTAAPAEAS